MKKSALIILAALLFSCGNEKSPKTASEVKNDPSGLSGVYEGRIGDSLYITLELVPNGDALKGTYFYKKIGEEIAIDGKRNGDAFSLDEKDAGGKATGVFSGKMFNGGDSLAGTWKNANGNRSYDFQLHRAEDPVLARIRFKWHYIVLREKKDPDNPEEPAYMEGYQYPEIAGLENSAVQQQLNRAFYPEELDEKRKDASYESVKEVNARQYAKIEWPHGHTTNAVRIDYYDSRVLTWSESSEWDGGAHPSFAFGGYSSVFLADGKTVTVNDLLQGGWKSAVTEAIGHSSIDSWMEGDDTECGHIADTLRARVAKWTGSEPVYPVTGKVIFIADDYRSFTCPEIARNVFEVSIDSEGLKPFIRPGSALDTPAETSPGR